MAVQIGKIKPEEITEASGIVASRKYPRIYWTHNDGDEGILYAIHRDGSLVGKVNLNVKVQDWEDIALDDAGNLYVSDTGNNDEDRKHVFVHRLPEPDPANLDTMTKAKVETSWRLTFPNKPFNGESLFIFKDHGYLISKRQDGGNARLYRFALNDDHRQELEKLFPLPIDQPVTAADVSADGKWLAVLMRGELDLFQIDGDVAHAETVQPTRVTFPPIKSEGCAFTDDGVIIIAESREIYLAPPPPSTRPASP